MTIKKRAIGGVKWTTFATVGLAIVSIIKLSVLTRFLEKADFGLMALVAFVLGFIGLFMDMGLTSAILHKQYITKDQYASLYWINILFSILLYAIIISISSLISSFYEELELKKILIIMGISLIFSAIGQQFKTIEQKELNFKFISIVDISSWILSLGLASILAINNAGVYALVYSALFQFLTSNISFFVFGIRKHGLRLHFKYNETKSYLKIGIYQVGGQIINYFNRDLDALIIGKFFGTDILGGYSLAKQLVFRPASIINPILTKVAAPTLAMYQDNITSLRLNYLKLVNILATLNFIMYFAIIILARPMVNILYGGGFEHIVILVRILSIYMFLRSIGNPVGSLVIATGRTDLEFKWNIISFFAIPAAVIIGSQFSIEWVALAITIAMLILQIPFWRFLIYIMLGIGIKEYFINFIPKMDLINYVRRNAFKS